ncbi:hypothetical protein D3C85_1463390 [compost metagenome]
MGDEQPATGEDFFHFLFVNRFVPEHLAGQPALFHVAQPIEIVQAGRRFDGSERYVFVVIHGSDSQQYG